MELNRDDHPYVEELTPGDSFDSFYVLRSLQMGTTRANKPFLVLDLTDRTGHIKAKLWEDAEAAYRLLEVGQIVKVRAVVEEYQGRSELKILKIRAVADENGMDRSRFLPTSGRDAEEDWAVIRGAVEKVVHPGLENLLQQLLEDREFVEQFSLAPAGKKWHHGYLGGLLEHTASLIGLVNAICDHYHYLNRDLLVAGAFLHDVGKLDELAFDTTFEYTMRGRLEGHIVMGLQRLNELAAEIEELDEETLIHLRHLVLSPQGSRENGCPVEPMSREAFVLYYVDEIDSKLNALQREFAKAAGGGGPFTDYIHLLGRFLLKPEGE